MNIIDKFLNEQESFDDIDRTFFRAGRANDKGVSETDVDPDELTMGIKVEMEHTTDPGISKRIALDHLAECPRYYTMLAKMEAECKNEK